MTPLGGDEDVTMYIGCYEVSCWILLVVRVLYSVPDNCELNTVRILFMWLEVDDETCIG